MEFSIERKDETLFDVVKYDVDLIEIALCNSIYPEYCHTIYLDKEEVFKLITKLVEMYGTMIKED